MSPCVPFCCLIGACGRRYNCLCVNVYLACRSAVGKKSENPRSCWKEMIGFRTWWPLCDRWLGAGLTEPKSPTRTYVGSHKPAHKNTHAYTKQYFKIPLHNSTSMSTCKHEFKGCVAFIYILFFISNTQKSRNLYFNIYSFFLQ